MSRVPPHDLEAERSVLASCLVSRANLVTVLDQGIVPSDFYHPEHSWTFAAMCALHDQGQPVDVVTVVNRSAAMGRPQKQSDLVGLLTAATAHPGHYAGIVIGHARCRDAIAAGDRLADAGYTADLDQVTDALGRVADLASGPVAQVDPPMEASTLADQRSDPDWIVPNLLARLEVVLFVAEPGAGKTTLMRQMAAAMASGRHPFTRVPIVPRRALSFDFQDPPGPAIRATRDMLACAGDEYQQTWWVELRQQGVDLTTPRDQAWMEAKIAKCAPDVVFAGPIYNMVRGTSGRSKQSEETAEIAGRFLMDVMVRHQVAFILEAHAPHGDDMRVRGSKYWEDFAAFGFGLKPDDEEGRRGLRVERFRGDREVGRQWPRRFFQGHGRWPWDAEGIPGRWEDDEHAF